MSDEDSSMTIRRRELMQRILVAGGSGVALGSLGACTDADPVTVPAFASGGMIQWVDTVLGSAFPSRTSGDLGISNSSTLGAVIAIAKGCLAPGDGGGGLFYWESGTTTGDDGGTIIVPTQGGGRWRRIYEGALNIVWFGAVPTSSPLNNASTPANNVTAIQRAFDTASDMDRAVYVPAGTFQINAPVGLTWTATSGYTARVYGDGPSSTIHGLNISAGRAVLELLGDGNTGAANVEVRNIGIHQQASSCASSSYCIRLGDAKAGVLLERVFSSGKNVLALRMKNATGSSGFAQINTLIRHCNLQVLENDSGLALVAEYNGVPTPWDLVRFENCLFHGLVQIGATIATFDSCMFTNMLVRGIRYGCNAEVLWGSALFTSCYFENGHAGVHIWPIWGQIHRVTCSDCWFSGTSEGQGAGEQCAYGVWADDSSVGPYTVGEVGIIRSVFSDDVFVSYNNGAGASVVNGDSVRNLVIEGAVNVSVSGLVGSLDSTPITVIGTSVGNFTIASGNVSDGRRIETVQFAGTCTAGTTVYAMLAGTANSDYLLISRMCWISRIRISIDHTLAGLASTPQLQIYNGATNTVNYTFWTGFTGSASGAANTKAGYVINPIAGIFHAGDLLKVRIGNASSIPSGTQFAVAIELAY